MPRNTAFTFSNASFPDTLITAIPPSPTGVAIAARSFLLHQLLFVIVFHKAYAYYKSINYIVLTATSTIMIRTVLFTLLLLASSSVFAQNAFSPDRPGFGFSSGTTAPGMFGLEAGITHSEFGTNIGEFFFRAGITDDFEVQIEAGSISVEDEKNGLTTQYLILKHKIYNTADGDIQVTLLNRTSLSFLQSDEDYTTQLYVLADFSLTNELSLSTNLGYGNYIFSERDNPELYFTINPGYILTPGTSVYLGLSYTDTNFIDETNYEFGIAHMIHVNSQIDLGLVLDDDNNPYLKTGIATRF